MWLVLNFAIKCVLSLAATSRVAGKEKIIKPQLVAGEEAVFQYTIWEFKWASSWQETVFLPLFLHSFYISAILSNPIQISAAEYCRPFKKNIFKLVQWRLFNYNSNSNMKNILNS